MTKNSNQGGGGPALNFLMSSTSSVSSLDWDRKQFTILTVTRTQSKLDTLEALLIKKYKPDLCKQKEFVCSLHLF